MCGRFGLTTDFGVLFERFQLKREDLDFRPRYNVAPTQQVLAVLDDASPDGPHGEMLRWGLIPAWVKDSKVGLNLINARAETVAMSGAFRTAFRRKRCLVLSDGFYEWRQDGKAKVPMRIVLKTREPFAFAGLWEEWTSPQGQTVRSCTIITTTPNAVMEPIHDRMPVILPREAEAFWLDGRIQAPEALTPLLVPYPGAEMEAYRVSPLVNNVRNDSPACIEPTTP